MSDSTAPVRRAERDGVDIGAVGSGHSWSDAALTGGILVEPQGLARPLELAPDLLTLSARERSLTFVEAGMRLHDLDAYLTGRGLALSNMGGYDHQTVAGVLATATHGSGLRYGPIADFAVSLDVVGTGGVVHRIEPRDGITDADAFAVRFSERVLRQDDHWFRAARVGAGTLGLLYAVTLEVEPSFWLTQRRSMIDWPQAREELLHREEMQRHRHYEMLFNPYRVGGREQRMLVTTRDIATQQEREHGTHHRHWLVELLGAIPLTPQLINLAFGLLPRISPVLLDAAMSSLVKHDYTNISYDVLNIGTATCCPPTRRRSVSRPTSEGCT
jgi:L-gulono-1,4-lactone dehydrogenase